MSPGIIGTYWLLASMVTAVVFSATARTIKRAAHRAGRSACPCGGAHQ